MHLAVACALVLVVLQDTHRSLVQMVLRWEDSHHGYVGEHVYIPAELGRLEEVACHGGRRDNHRVTPRCPTMTRPKEHGASRGVVRFDSSGACAKTLGVVVPRYRSLALALAVVLPALVRVSCGKSVGVLAQGVFQYIVW